MMNKDRMRIKQEMLGNGITDHNGLSWLCSYMATQARAVPALLPGEKELLRQLDRKSTRLNSSHSV